MHGGRPDSGPHYIDAEQLLREEAFDRRVPFYQNFKTEVDQPPGAALAQPAAAQPSSS